MRGPIDSRERESFGGAGTNFAARGFSRQKIAFGNTYLRQSFFTIDINFLFQKVTTKYSPTNHNNINGDSLLFVISKIVDYSWQRKACNVSYINVVTKLLLLREELVTIRTLNVGKLVLLETKCVLVGTFFLQIG